MIFVEFELTGTTEFPRELIERAASAANAALNHEPLRGYHRCVDR